MKNEVSPGVIAIIVVVVLLVVGGVGYALFFKKTSGVSGAEAVDKTKAMQTKQAELQQDMMSKRGAGGTGGNSQQQHMMEQQQQQHMQSR